MKKPELLAMIVKPLKVFPLSSIKVAFMPITVGHANGIFLLRKGEKRKYFPSQNSHASKILTWSIWQLMALLLLRHALTITDPDGDDDASAFFSVSGI